MVNSVSVITSYYNDLYKINHWKTLVESKNYNIILYEKSDNLKIGEKIVNENNIIIPNYGKSDYAFLTHIINNYDNLSNTTIFTKINWYEQIESFKFLKLLEECINYDYYEVGSALSAYVWYNNDNLHLKKITDSLSVSYHNVDAPMQETGNIFNLENRPSRIETFEDWYSHIFLNRNNLPAKVYAFGHAHCFSVSRDLIRRHDISVYKYLLERFHPDSNSSENKSKEEINNHFADCLGRFYGILFTHNIDKKKFNVFPPCPHN